MPITVNFFGLCGIGMFDREMHAVMPAAKKHHPTLLIRAEDCDARTTSPDFVVHDTEGVQILGWDRSLRSDLTFASTTGNAAWHDSAQQEALVNLARHEKNKPTRRLGTMPALRLPGGDLFAGTGTQPFTLLRGGVEVEPERLYATSAIWIGAANRLVSGTRALAAFRDNAVLTFSNLAPEIDGRDHFGLYYEQLFLPVPDAAHQIKLDGSRGVEVFDCVPPVPLP
jgi:hypothetical protein